MNAKRSTWYPASPATFPEVTDGLTGEGFYPDGLTESAIDALLEEVDRELAADEHAASAAFLYDFTDQRRAARARRRAGRQVLRESHWLIAGVPSQGKSAAIRQAVISDEIEAA
ncbi:hypothetical protein AORI_7544 [Amycolatopsis keratiniphila]|uniref:Uncharacterized protein n=2 Tax=Amycolatopsis keratiniphila TaxID=129921 RepID=R4TD08_9PSEU|nr:hypothetical protein AORI_7544 [Amycolatopsis keratiniphila]